MGSALKMLKEVVGSGWVGGCEMVVDEDDLVETSCASYSGLSSVPTSTGGERSGGATSNERG